MRISGTETSSVILRQTKPSLNRTTIFKLVAHGIELRAAFGERENKQNNT